MIELVEKNIKTIIIIVLHMFQKLEESFNMLNRDIKTQQNIQKLKLQCLRGRTAWCTLQQKRLVNLIVLKQELSKIKHRKQAESNIRRTKEPSRIYISAATQCYFECKSCQIGGLVKHLTFCTETAEVLCFRTKGCPKTKGQSKIGPINKAKVQTIIGPMGRRIL